MFPIDPSRAEQPSTERPPHIPEETGRNPSLFPDSISPASPNDERSTIPSAAKRSLPNGTPSIREFFELLNEALKELKQALLSGNIAEQETRTAHHLVMLERAKAIAAQQIARDRALKELEESMERVLEEIDESFDTFNEVIDKVNEEIARENLRQEEDAWRFQEWIDAHHSYLDALRQEGITRSERGFFEIPPGKEKVFEQLTKDFGSLSQKFDAYRQRRCVEIEAFHRAVDGYHGAVARTFAEWSSLLHQQGIPLEHLSQFPDLIRIQKIDLAPYTFPLNDPVSDAVFDFTSTQTAPILPLHLHPQGIRDGLYQALYPSRIAPFDLALAQASTLRTLSEIQRLFHPLEQETKGEHASLLEQLLPTASVQNTKKIEQDRINFGITSIFNDADNEFLTPALLQEIADQRLETEQATTLRRHFSAFAGEVLSSASREALFNTISRMSQEGTSSPERFPTSLVFTLELYKLTSSATFEMSLVPALQEMFEALAPNANVDLFAKELQAFLLRTIKALIAHLLSVPQSQQPLTPRSTTATFEAQGIAEAQAHFLSQLTTQLLNRGGLWMPPRAIGENTLDKNLVLDSLLGAALVRYPTASVAELKTVFQAALNDTLRGNAYASQQQFVGALKESLIASGMTSSEARIASSAVIATLPSDDVLRQIDKILDARLFPQLIEELKREAPNILAYPSAVEKETQRPMESQERALKFYHFASRLLDPAHLLEFAASEVVYGKRQATTLKRSSEIPV